MSAVKKVSLIPVAEYLRGELRSQIKHDYVGGLVYAMSGASIAHNIIAGNVFVSLHNRLRGRPCRPFHSDMKVRIQLTEHVRFYYPDVSIVCNSNPQQQSFQDEPRIIVEVLSRSTRRIDFGEKRDAYLMIPSLHVYALVEQDEPTVVVFRRGANGFEREVYESLSAVLPLPEIETELSLAEIYEGVEFTPEPDDADAP